MATLRSSLPSRLRQLLSGGESAIGPSVKLDSELPPKVKAFIDKVIQSPLQDIAIPLSGFRWEYSKGNFHHWRPLFLHFDKYFKTYLSCRNDLLLSDKILEDNSQFPKHDVLQILRVMRIILENCPNKSSFDGLEHFKLLLASTDPDVLVATLETLVALVKITPSKLHGTGKLIGCGSVNSHLLSLAQGWGSKEEGLGLYDCIVANERTQEGLSLFPSDSDYENERSHYRVGSTLYFDFHEQNPQGAGGSDAVFSKLKVIQIPDLHLRKEDDLCLMKQCVEQYHVPTELRFALLTRIRYANAFRSPRMCRLYSRICLLAFIILVQSNDASEELASFFANEPEYTNELIRIVRSEEAVPGNIRTHAMLALGAQLAAYTSSHERARVLSGSNTSFVGGNRMIILNLLQKAILSLNNSNDPSSLAFVEALLQFYLLHVVSTPTTGSSLRGSGMVPTFLPLLEDSYPSHLHLLCLAVKTLQKLMDYSSSAVSTFKDLGGVELLAQRLQVEVHRVIDCAGGSENLMTFGDYSKSSEEQLDSQKRLIKVLLKALGSATYSPGNAARSQNADNNLPATLSLILGNADKFGGEIYSSAVVVMSEMIHKDPTCFSVLHEMGLPAAFLSSVVVGLPPSSKAINCVPNGLGAICLNAKGLEEVKQSSALRFLVDVFTGKKYALAMNEAIVPLANAVEELLRHVSSLRGTGVDLVIEIIDKITALGDGGTTELSEKVAGRTEMELDSVDRRNDNACSLVGDTESMMEEISNEQFNELAIFHLIVLLHRMIENSETCRLFVEKSGIEVLLKLLLRPSVVQSSEGISIALHSTMVFKGFTQHHSAPLSRAFCSSLRDQLNKAFAEMSTVSGTFWLDSNSTLDSGLFSSLFLVEFLLFLAASKDNRWIAALLTEFGGDSKDVVGDIGRLHREVLWQVALLEDSKHESEAVASSSAADSHQVEFSTSGTEEQRFNSFRQILDPLLRRRSTSWSVESQFFDIINLYRDIGRTSTSHQRNVEGSSNLQSSSGPQVDHSTSSSAAGNSQNESDKKRSHYIACCDMVRSLSFHITHLFQELGKAMLLPSRRRDESPTVSTTSISVASSFATIALDHLNFVGHECQPVSEVSVSTKCRYFGKVMDSIDVILLERPDSCNPVLLNCFYGHGVIQLILTTFEATSQLLSAVNRTSATPMETDEKPEQKQDTEDYSWIDGPLVSYGKLMDHLVTSSFILSPFTKNLLVQSLTNGDFPFPRDGEAFVKALQSMVVKAILPVWNHPHFTECSHDFIATSISIIKHTYLGVEVKDTTSNISARIFGPPPNESTIATIVEMGFPRARAEEALRRVGSNSVELAMEWLFTHPEEPQEEDELARALAMSLGKSESDTKEDAPNDATQHLEEEMAQLPPVEELLSTCMRLLQTKESLVFPVRDIFVTLCSQSDGQNRSSIISFVIGRLKDCSLSHSSENNTLLSALFHVIALVFHEDAVAREVALESGLIKLVADLLSQWESSVIEKGNSEVPKWVTTAFLAIDRVLQADQNVDSEIIEQLKGDNDHQSALSFDEDKQRKLQSAFGSSLKCIDIHEQKRLIEVACTSIRNQLPSETVHAVLQLCSTLTRNHYIAVSFLDLGCLTSLLSLPTSSLFPGFDSIAASIIRHILEDPQTLQQAMETQIKHNIVVARGHSNGRVTPRNFLLNLNSVITRDPVTFVLAAQNVCQVEMVGDMPYIILQKDREKEKHKEKEKEKEKGTEKEKPQITEGKVTSKLSSASPGIKPGKNHDLNYRSVKVHRKTPQSFIHVIEQLVESIMAFVPLMKEEEMQTHVAPTDMDIDVTASKGKGKAVAVDSPENEAHSRDVSASLAKIVFILKLLTEILLMYTSSVHVLLRLDAEISNCRGLPDSASTGVCSGGLFHHVLHKFLPYVCSSKREKKPDGEWRHKLATRANQFLVAACVRSTEARKRVFVEINLILNEFVASYSGVRPPSNDLQAYVDLLNDVLGANSPTNVSLTTEASVTFIDVGLVKALTQTLQVLDLDHSDSPKVITGLVKALELVTREHVQSATSNAARGENSAKPTENNQTGTGNEGVLASNPPEVTSHSNDNSLAGEHGEPFNAVQSLRGSEAVTDDMEHDQDLGSGFPPATEDDFMQDIPEDARENIGMDSGGIHFEIQPSVQENIDDEDDDDDDDDDGDEGDEDEEDEHIDLEEDEFQYLPHPDIDQDDHDIDDDEFDDEVLQEEDDDEDDDDGVILRLEEGISGINVFDHIEVFNRDHAFSNETLQVMPVEVFGSRRQGRTTSIYNLLGRSGESTVSSRHPLLIGPSFHAARQSGSSRDMLYPDRNLESSSSRLDAIFRTIRNGRQGQRMNFWVDSMQVGGSNAAVVPQGFEEFLVSQLRRPDPEKPVGQNTTDVQQYKGEGTQLQVSEAGERPEITVENHSDDETSNAPPSSADDVSGNADVRPAANEGRRGVDGSTMQTQTIEMQSERSDATVRDVEAVSQESGGSGATLGESLRSLDVEIGSADGHDDGGERQASSDRMPVGDSLATRQRRTNGSYGSAAHGSGREASLHSVTEVSESSSREADQDGQGAEQQVSSDAGSGSIDPAFLQALPEELRAEVLSSQQGEETQPSNTEQQNAGEIDPEFLAALPPDIRAEVLAQQQAQRMHQSQELEGQPVEMDAESIIATFPSDLREEVLLTSSDAILSNLTPALVAEANMLRERFANRFHNRTLFGMYPRSRRGDTSRWNEGIGSLDRAGGSVSRRSAGGKVIEVEGAPLVDSEALQAMIRLLCVFQPLYKGQLQRLLLNLCAHRESRISLVKILLNMLMLNKTKSIGCDGEIVSSFRLYACKNNVICSRSQLSDGVPPLVSRRILETLTYLAKSHLYVANILLQFRLSLPSLQAQNNIDQESGKAVVVVGGETGSQQHQEYFAVALILGLLNQPLYLRSMAHLEQLLNLLEVIIDNAENKASLGDKLGASNAEQSAPQVSSTTALMTTDASGVASDDVDCNSLSILLGLPQSELRLLCSLLAREGLSDNAYMHVANVLKKLVAIVPAHCYLFIKELADAIQNLAKSAMNELHVFGETVEALLSTTSSDGTAILRVLQAVSSFVVSLTDKDKDQQLLSEEVRSSALFQVSSINTALEPLWLELSTCVSNVERYSDTASDFRTPSRVLKSKPSSLVSPLPAGSQNILPYIESFFVTCEKLHPAQPGTCNDFSFVPEAEEVSSSVGQQKNMGSAPKFDERNIVFVKFCEKHRKLLNAFIRQSSGLLEKSFSLMLKVPRFIDFDNKRAHFRSKIKHQHGHHHSPLRISVRRAYILEDSYNQLRMRSAQELKGRLTVHFQGEEGIDAGGLTREWYQLLSRVIFDKGALLFTTVGNESTFQPNPNSVYQTEHLSYFKFVGRVVGKALFDGQLLDVHFTRSFYKHILGAKVTYHDIEAIDPDYYKNLKWMLENDISDVLDLTFSIDADEEKLILYERTEVTDYELIPGGRNIRVTEENKHQYVDLIAEHRLTTAIRPQISTFLEGFNDLIPRELISIFHDKELELLISGLPDIDLDDLRANTEYSGYSAGSPVIQWFWEVVQSFSKEDKARLLQFVTGTSKVPLEGFSALQGISGAQKFQIHKAYGSPDHLPSAHTCFNQLDLPEYPSKEHLEERLLLAVHEANEGFGFG